MALFVIFAMIACIIAGSPHHQSAHDQQTHHGDQVVSILS